MAERNLESRAVQLPLLDRLVDTRVHATSEPPPSRARSIEIVKEAVRRDLQWLLNTRRSINPVSPDLPQLQDSLLEFGLPDISSLSADSAKVRTGLAKQIKAAIARFEPRMTKVDVQVAESMDEHSRQLRFTIVGVLHMTPISEEIVLDTVVDVASGDFRIK